jgi:plastocyanin
MKRLIFASSLIAFTTFGGSAMASGSIYADSCSALSAAPRVMNGFESNDVSVAAGDTVTWTGLGIVNIFGSVAGTTSGSATNGAKVFSAAGTERFALGVDGTTLSCTPASSSNAGSTSGSAGGESQSGATATGVGQNSDNRFGDGDGNTATKNSIFVSTQNLGSGSLETPDWNAWISAEARTFAGGFSGGSLDMVGGIDKLINNDLLVGVLFGYGRVAVVEGGVSASALSPMFGVYVGSRTESGLVIDGFATGALPVTSTSGTSFTSTRYAAGLTITGRSEFRGNELRPYLNAKGFTEAQPAYIGTGGAVAANSIQSLTVSAGVRMNFVTALPGTELQPFISGAIDYRNRTSTLNGVDTFFYPRIGFGVNGPLSGGQFSFSIDAGKSRSDTIDIGALLKLEFIF